MKTRKDNKGRNLRKGETQRKDGRYVYKYYDGNGNSHFEYSWRLTAGDRTPQGKKADLCLREKEDEINKKRL